MNNLLWIHTLQPNELGIRKGDTLGGGKSFRLPQLEEVMALFPPLNEANNYTQRISLNFVENGEIKETFENLEFTDARKNNPNRVEHKIYLNNMGEYIGLEGSDKVFQPYVTLGFYKNTTNQICFEVLPEGSILENIKASKTDALIDVVQISPQKYNFKGLTLLSKPFLLLAGISGTGKTRFVREQAKATNQFNETYCLTSVRPDWHEPSDLLGYISRLNGNAEYVTTDVLQFIGRAWRGIADSSLAINAQNIDGQGEHLVVSGDSETLNDLLPYWLCLDEMNLAPVEQYFADYLSVLETREWKWNGDNFSYRCDALLKPMTFEAVADLNKLRKDLGFEESKYDDLWSLICQYGLSIPFNLMVAGTVNMDETTHGFSRKVIDRALSFDFGEFFPNDYNQFFSPENQDKTLSFPIYSHAKKDHLTSTIDSDGQRSIDFLSAVNEVLANTPFQLAYRALNELLLAVISANPQDELALKAVWDDFLMCKVLPRIEGDIDKLGSDPSLLEKLEKVLVEDQLKDIWNELANSATARPDLFRDKKVGTDDADKVITIGCRSKTKITGMQTRLRNTSFTSFWP